VVYVDHVEINVDHDVVDVDQGAVNVDHDVIDVDHDVVDVDQGAVDVDHDKINVDHDEINVDHDVVNVDQDEINVDQDEINVDQGVVDVDHDEINVDQDEINVDQGVVDVDHDEINVDQGVVARLNTPVPTGLRRFHPMQDGRDPALDGIPLQRSEGAGVAAVESAVAEEEVASPGNDGGAEALAGAVRQLNRVGAAGERLHLEPLALPCGPAAAHSRGIGGLVAGLPAVDDQPAIPDLDDVSGHSDDPLERRHRAAVRRRDEDEHHVAPERVGPSGEGLLGERHLEVICQLVDQHQVAHMEPGSHRLSRQPVDPGAGRPDRSQHHHRRQHRDQQLPPFPDRHLRLLHTGEPCGLILTLVPGGTAVP
jgi:hypothetical protein